MSRDGEHRECPEIEDFTVRIKLSDDIELLVAPSHDSIVMFPDPQYTYLRYFDHEDNVLRAIWLPEEVYAQLAEMGIPITMRESITLGEKECHAQYLGQIATAGVAMLSEVMEDGPELTEAEVEWFWKEFGE